MQQGTDVPPLGGGGYAGMGYGVRPFGPSGNGLAIGAVTVAGSGLLSFWMPFLNVYAFLACAVAVGLAVAALVRGRKHPRPPRVLAVV